MGRISKPLDKSSNYKSRRKNPPGPLYKGEKFATGGSPVPSWEAPMG